MTPMQQDQQHQPKPPEPPGYQPKLSPRANGALLLGIGMAAEGFNVFTLFDSSTFYPKILILGAVLMPLGLWTLVTGIAFDPATPVKPPTWWTVGAVLITIVGLLVGIGATVAISD